MESRSTGSNARTIGGLVVSIIAGAVFGGLIAEVGGHSFGQYVRSFYPPSFRYSKLMDTVCVVGTTCRPVAWFGSTIGAVYYCWRKRISTQYVFCGEIAGFVLGFLTSGYIHADPGPNYDTSLYNVPAFCLAGTVIGVIVQAIQRDWLQCEPLNNGSIPD